MDAVVRWAGRISEVRLRQVVGESRKGKERVSRRGVMQGWSRKSRRNLLRTLLAIEWPTLEAGLVPVMVTLTYAGVPMDGRECRRHLAAFRKAWRRQWGVVLGAWKLEFQARGAAHWHLVLWVPYRVLEDGEIRAVDRQGRLYRWQDGREWLGRQWGRIAGAENQVVQWLWWSGEDFAAYFAGYTSKEGGKEYQNEPPVGSSGWGRRWGLWGIRPEWREEMVAESEGVRIRRVQRGVLRARNRRRRVKGGAWLIHASPDARRTFLVRVRGLR